LKCGSLNAVQVRRFRYASAIKYVCKMNTVSYLIEHYGGDDENPVPTAMAGTKLVIFTPSYVMFYPGFGETLVNGRDLPLYVWRRRFGNMDVADTKRLKSLESENQKLKKLLAERDLEVEVLKEVAAKKW